jgi:AcrR family transcriptional regulator
MATILSDRRPRRDAQNNRAQILDVAGSAFVNAGVEVSMDAIAKQAGLGPGTLYRHFPNKDALLAALMEGQHHRLLDERRKTIELEEAHAGRALELWTDALGDWMLAYDGLPEPLRAAWSNTRSPLRTTCESLVAVTQEFLSAAQSAGFARPALTGQDLFLGALAVAWASGRTTASEKTRSVLRDVFRTGWAQT